MRANSAARHSPRPGAERRLSCALQAQQERWRARLGRDADRRIKRLRYQLEQKVDEQQTRVDERFDRLEAKLQPLLAALGDTDSGAKSLPTPAPPQRETASPSSGPASTAVIATPVPRATG